ncbi:MAG: HDOD domain-containing protein [Phycisphaera sp.]|nr:MAG: HDOD domain-containing protein [Phycisphaera sp.]
MPKLLSVGNIDVIAVRPSGEKTKEIEALCSGKHAITLDCRVHPEAVLFGFVRFCWGDFTRAPIVLFHHHDEHAMGVLGGALNVVASLDAGKGSLEDVIRELITVLSPRSPHASVSPETKPAAPPDSVTGSDGATKSGKRKKSKPPAASKKSKPPAEEPAATPGRQSASGKPAKKPSREKPPRPLKLNTLYNDDGLLDREAREAEHLAEGWPFRRDKPPQFERRLSRKETAAKVAQFAEAKQLKATTQMALRIARDSTASVEDLAQIVKLDQALAARILQLANSSLNRRGKATRTIEQAIVRLGMSTIRESISSMTVLDQFNESEVLNVAMLWEHGYAVGLLAADIARSAGSISPDDAFVIGLMHDMGRAVMACELGQDYVDALIAARMHDVLPAQVEKQFFELNHADAAETILPRGNSTSRYLLRSLTTTCRPRT